MNHTAYRYTNVKKISLLKLSEHFLIFIGLACFSASLFFPTFFTSADHIHGFWVLITGWVGLIFFQCAWYANPLNLLALLLYKEKPKTAMLITLIAVVLASSSFLFKEIPIGINSEKVFIKEYGLGFYLWYAAQILTATSIVIHFIDSLRKQ